MVNFGVIKAIRTDENGIEPKLSALGGLDIFVPNDFKSRVMAKGDSLRIPSRLKLSLSEDAAPYYSLLAINNNEAFKRGLMVSSSLIPENEEFICNIFKISDPLLMLEPGMKIATIILSSKIQSCFYT